MAAGSQKPTFKDHGIALPAHCHGCGRQLTASKETAMWFKGNTVYGYCCWTKAAAA